MNKSLALAHFQTSFQFITHQNERFSYLEGAYLALIGGC
ncbi:MAG: thiamine phosphate synthase, partial [Prevotella sp.]|nr:thiamine phosphate synthase [Prevotella sp.]